MSDDRALPLFLPIFRAIHQLDDRAFVGVAVRSVAWSAASFAGLLAAAVWCVHRVLDLHGPLAWAADVLGTAGASILALWLFLPVAACIGTLYFDRVALAVERRFYPCMPAPSGAGVFDQIQESLAVAGKVAALNVAALLLPLVMPGIGFLLGWLIAAYAIGRGLFVAAAMRRMPRARAEFLYRSRRGIILANGAILATAAYIPGLNLLIPVIGTAAMVHVLDLTLTAVGAAQRDHRDIGPQSYKYE